jgi:hypothetical protein
MNESPRTPAWAGRKSLLVANLPEEYAPPRNGSRKTKTSWITGVDSSVVGQINVNEGDLPLTPIIGSTPCHV